VVAQAARLDWAGYSARWKAMHGGYDPDAANPAVRGWLKLSYLLARGLARLGASPGMITVAGLVVCLFVPAVAAQPGAWAALSGALVLLAGLLDSLDGALAVVTRRVTRFGYVYDGVVDRVGEAAWLVAFWVVGAPGWLAGLTAFLIFLHEYLRARAMSAGQSRATGATVSERPIRVLICALGLLLAGGSGAVSDTLAAGAGTLAVAIWLLLGLVGFLQLFAAVRRDLR
jgi:phosphatidylglycerophosphate synthase